MQTKRLNMNVAVRGISLTTLHKSITEATHIAQGKCCHFGNDKKFRAITCVQKAAS
jgi:hypothetical protein